MTRPVGSKNKPKNKQLLFKELGIDTETTISKPMEILKLVEDEVINTMEIAHALRVINQGNLEEVNQNLKAAYFDKGWNLFNTHFAGMQPEGMIIIYIFTRELSAS